MICSHSGKFEKIKGGGLYKELLLFTMRNSFKTLLIVNASRYINSDFLGSMKHNVIAGRRIIFGDRYLKNRFVKICFAMVLHCHKIKGSPFIDDQWLLCNMKITYQKVSNLTSLSHWEAVSRGFNNISITTHYLFKVDAKSHAWCKNQCRRIKKK